MKLTCSIWLAFLRCALEDRGRFRLTAGSTGFWVVWLVDDVGAVYITYYPDLAVPGATEAIQAFCAQAMKTGVRRLVLLSGRGEEEAQRAEQALIASGADWTIVRASWFRTTPQRWSNKVFRQTLRRSYCTSSPQFSMAATPM